MQHFPPHLIFRPTYLTVHFISSVQNDAFSRHWQLPFNKDHILI